MGISFLSIPTDIRTPASLVEFDSSRASRGPAGPRQRILFIGTRLAAGTIEELVVKQILSATQAEGYFGRGSQLSRMLRAAKAANALVEMWAMGLNEPGAGTAATGTLAITGPATKAGTLPLYIAGQLVQVGIAKDQTAAQIATAIVAAIAAATDLPLTAAVDGDVTSQVNLTARWKGLTGNDIDVRVGYYESDAVPAGVTIAVTDMADGAGAPDLDDAIAAFGDTQFSSIVVAFNDAGNMAKLETEMERRFGASVQLDAFAFAAARGTHAELVTLGTARNSRLDSIMGSGASPTPPWTWASVVAAVSASEPDPARQRTGLALPGVLAPAVPDRFTQPERDILLHDGISTFTVDDAGNCAIERLITTYQTTPANVPDTTYLDVTTLLTLSAIRFGIIVMDATKFPRYKLADDGTDFPPGARILTPKSMKAALIQLFIGWLNAGMTEDAKQFSDDIVVERDLSDPNRLNRQIAPHLIGQFLVGATQVQFLL